MMMDSTKSYTHTCSNSSCEAVIAVYEEGGKVDVKEPLPPKLVPSRNGIKVES